MIHYEVMGFKIIQAVPFIFMTLLTSVNKFTGALNTSKRSFNTPKMSK